MDNHTEIRHSFLGGFSILLVEGIVWMLSGILGDFVSVSLGILIIIVGGTFFYPLGLLVQLLLKRPKVRKENSLNALFTQVGLIIPFTLPLLFMITSENVNLFYPALTIIIGAHFLPFIYAYKMNTFWILAALLVVGGTYFGFMMKEHFAYCAYYTGSILLVFALINGFLTKNEIKKVSNSDK